MEASSFQKSSWSIFFLSKNPNINSYNDILHFNFFSLLLCSFLFFFSFFNKISQISDYVVSIRLKLRSKHRKNIKLENCYLGPLLSVSLRRAMVGHAFVIVAVGYVADHSQWVATHMEPKHLHLNRNPDA